VLDLYDNSISLKLVTTKVVGDNIGLLAIQPDAALGNDPHVQRQPTDDPAFVALADVPDNVWKSNVNVTSTKGSDGKSHRTPGPGSRGQRDNPNHFADLDLPYEGSDTFLELNVRDPDRYLDPQRWVAY
jgi:hypothetical protein